MNKGQKGDGNGKKGVHRRTAEKEHGFYPFRAGRAIPKYPGRRPGL